MPASTRGVKRDKLTFVKVNEWMYYGWNAPKISTALGVSDADLKTQLGHETIETVSSGLLMVTGANSPKPARFTKKLPNAPVGQRASVTTFCAYDSQVAAVQGGWRKSKAERRVPIRTPRAGDRTIDVRVSLSSGFVYIQPVDAAVATPERRAFLGISTANQSTIDSKRFVRGSRTKPGKVRVNLGDGTFAILPFSSRNDVVKDRIAQDDNYELIEDEFIEFMTGVVPF